MTTPWRESTIGLYKTGCTRHEGPWCGVDDLELATLNWVSWLNQTRLHSGTGHVPPIEFENRHYSQINPGSSCCRGNSLPSTEPGAVQHPGHRLASSGHPPGYPRVHQNTPVPMSSE
jgi:hypothetical protein